MFSFLDAWQPTVFPAVCFLVWLPVFVICPAHRARAFFLGTSIATILFVAGPILGPGLLLINIGGYVVVEAVARTPLARGPLFFVTLLALHAGYWACFRLLIPAGYCELLPDYAAGTYVLFSGIGLTFFRLVSYFWERVRRRRPPLGPGDYLAHMLFFPQFRHGPIERAHEFAPRLRDARCNWQPRDVAVGLARVALGALVLVGLRQAIRYGVPVAYKNNPYRLLMELFEDPTSLSLPALLLLLHAPAAALYALESASAHLQLGVARAFGVRGSENFRYPFRAANPADVWRRWNITLSFWLRDYAFFPLCRWRALRHVSIVLTFVYAGLLHGLAWRHAVWGVYMGLAVLLYVGLFERRRNPTAAPAAQPHPVRAALGRLLARLATIHVLCIGGLIFFDPRHAGARVLYHYGRLLLGLVGF